MMDLEQLVQCPACWETHSVLIDPIEGEQEFVEDCAVCCRPMSIRVRVEDDAVVSVEVEDAN
ncbi:MAG: CPXCG motif-containing cysteine-rich protein [Pseudomonadota bacterium]